MVVETKLTYSKSRVDSGNWPTHMDRAVKMGLCLFVPHKMVLMLAFAFSFL